MASAANEQADRAVLRVAERFVRTWGLTTVGMVSRLFRVTAKTTETRTVIARRALARLPDLRWLDPEHEWFTLVDADSPTKAALDKILALRGNANHDELVRALDKGHALRLVPREVLRAYFDALVARRGRADSGTALATPEERALVAALERAGGTADLEVLRHEAERRAIPGEAVTRTLGRSPLFLRVARGTYRLVGNGVPLLPRPLLGSGPWEAWDPL